MAKPEHFNKTYDKSYKVATDARNWILVEHYVSDAGKEMESQIGFYPTLHSLLKAAPNQLVLAEGVEKLPTILEKLDALLGSAEESVAALEKAREVCKSERAKKIAEKGYVSREASGMEPIDVMEAAGVLSAEED